ncbi:phospholipase D-like domain-containing protein [Ferroacidibacillus organovorans]|uniref:PLD phosphodiesterase domain-containing protein n=1 Tax=Ferroacidibacillus organovorans TaxID=1765683 RepID=A0A101XT92_9BACL|nr:phospholipase D-like domain-containing protein [Ferroacidibacillus organovorans]KUO97164.1 hypothetical protein ATW55_12715 [Ferroacidibacillus organovorans]
MSYRELEDGFLIAIALIISSQLIVILISLISNQFRRQRKLSIINQPPVETVIDENQITIYTYGMDFYQALIRDITQAQEIVCVESFIWKADAVGQEIKDLLAKKAGEGVSVFVVFDSFANLVVPRAFKRFSPDIHLYRYRAWQRFLDLFDPRRLARDHRKLAIIDRKISYVGGFNIGDLYGRKWRDTHVRIEGRASHNLFATFCDFWNAQTHKLPKLKTERASLSPYIRPYVNNPQRILFPIRAMYIEAIDLAKERVYLTTPYFVPDRVVLSALMDAADRGVQISLLVPERSNHLLADWLARTYFTDCLKRGIRIFLYQGSMIHAKTATVDGKWTTIGTANLDRLSLFGNHEINVEFFSAEMAAQMEKMFEYDLKACRELSLVEWNRRPMTQKLGELVLSPLWPFL